MRVLVQAADFSPGGEIDAMLTLPGVGGIGSFLGIVRSDAARPISAMTLEHYPAMTLPALTGIATEAEQRFALRGCTIIHRFGRLPVGARIVLVIAAAAHRQPALDATTFLIDWLKTKAPFWKQEHFLDGTDDWVMAKAEDDAAAGRWQAAPPA